MTGEIPSTQRSSSPPAEGVGEVDDARLALGVLAYALAPLAVAWMRGRPGVDGAWDFLMAVGLVATGGLAILPLLSARWWAGRHRDPGLLRLVQRLHRQLSYLMAAFVAAHVLGVLVLEPRTFDYLLPTAPAYMVAGLAALLLLLVLVVTSQGGLKRRWPQASWRGWHATFSIVGLGALAWHLVGSGFWFVGAGPWWALAWLLGVPTGLALYWRGRRTLAAPGGRSGSARRSSPHLLAALALLLVLACAWFALRFPMHAGDAKHPVPCPVGRCL